MTPKIIISYPDTLKGYAAAFAAWYGLYVAVPPDVARPEVIWFARKGAEATPLQDADKMYVVPQLPAETWNLYVDGYPIPDVIRYVEDEKNKLPGSKAARAYIASLGRQPKDLEFWLTFNRFEAVFAGEAILRFEALSEAEKASFLWEAVGGEVK